ncbi:hypothetical protein Dimus_030380 [Dionaea muscipula]
MGKQGPCYHCGVTSTPLWRNGPPDKPVLCNACGSRWRTKGTLANYTPLHARAENDDFEGHRASRFKNTLLKTRDEKPNKRKLNYDNTMIGGVAQEYNQNFHKYLDEDISNRSSSGSAVSNSESCAQFGGADVSDLTGPSQSVVWDTMVPSRKRTCITRPKPSPVEKLTKDLHNILHEQSCQISGSSEDDLLFESETPMVSVEIGHGSVLIRHPSSVTREEESEASSLSVDNKLCTTNEAYSPYAALLGHKAANGVNNIRPGIDRVKKLSGQMIQHEQPKREKSYHERLQMLWNHNTPLSDIDLTDVVNMDVFRGYLTVDEQRQLLKYLPSTDISTLSDSLQSIFASPYFKENLSSFQQLLAEGFFETSSAGVRAEDCKILKRLALTNSSKSKWVEKYSMIKDSRIKENTDGSLVASSVKVIKPQNGMNTKRPRDVQDHHISGVKTSMKSPKRLLVRASQETKEVLENDGSCFSPRSLFALPTGSSTLMLESFHMADESSDQDLLFDVPSVGSFPQAELLHPALSVTSYGPCASSSSVHPTLFRL